MRAPFCVIAPLALLYGCAPGNDSTPGRVESPSGRYVATTWVNRDKADMMKYLCVAFEIRDAAGNPVHREQTGSSDRMRWEFQWDDRDRLWMYSGDIGTYRWERRDDGTWARAEANATADMPPPRIKAHHDRIGHLR